MSFQLVYYYKIVIFEFWWGDIGQIWVLEIGYLFCGWGITLGIGIVVTRLRNNFGKWDSCYSFWVVMSNNLRNSESCYPFSIVLSNNFWEFESCYPFSIVLSNNFWEFESCYSFSIVLSNNFWESESCYPFSKSFTLLQNWFNINQTI